MDIDFKDHFIEYNTPMNEIDKKTISSLNKDEKSKIFEIDLLLNKN
mgnify:CR=1 FL=1